MIKAITLQRPWPWAIIHGKPIENRNWAPREFPIGGYLAIHAGLAWDPYGPEFIQERSGLEVPREAAHPKGCIVAVCRFMGTVRQSSDPWFCGPVGWKLDQVQSIEPVYCRGAQGLWDLPDDVLSLVRAAWLKSRRRAA